MESLLCKLELLKEEQYYNKFNLDVIWMYGIMSGKVKKTTESFINEVSEKN